MTPVSQMLPAIIAAVGLTDFCDRQLPAQGYGRGSQPKSIPRAEREKRKAKKRQAEASKKRNRK
jgi:hypothetical protein